MQYGLSISFSSDSGKVHWHLYRKGEDGVVVSSYAMGYGDSIADAAQAAERYYNEHVAPVAVPDVSVE